MFFWEMPLQRPPGDGSGEGLLWARVCALNAHTHKNTRTHKHTHTHTHTYTHTLTHFLIAMHLYSILAGLHNTLFGFLYLLKGVDLYYVADLNAC